MLALFSFFLFFIHVFCDLQVNHTNSRHRVSKDFEGKSILTESCNQDSLETRDGRGLQSFSYGYVYVIPMNIFLVFCQSQMIQLQKRDSHFACLKKSIYSNLANTIRFCFSELNYYTLSDSWVFQAPFLGVFYSL